MRWQAQRGLLNPLDASPPGSVWWRATNERLLRDGWEAIALVGGLLEIRRRTRFGSGCSSLPPRHRHVGTALTTPASWPATWSTKACQGRERSRALLHERRAGARPLRARPRRGPATRARAIRSACPPPRRSPARNCGRVPLAPARDPNYYPLTRDVEWYIADEQRLGRLLDYAVIAPRLQRLYEWSAEVLAEPRLLGLVRDGSPIYAWPYEQRHVWRAGAPAVPRPADSNAFTRVR